MIHYKNPNAFVYKVDDFFYALVNPFIKDGIKIINSNQFKIYNEIDGARGVEQLAKVTKFSQEEILMVSEILEEKEYINTTGIFKEPTWGKKAKSLNLWVHTTNDCVLRCPYCYIHTLGQKEYIKEHSINVLCKKLIETAKKRKLKSITLRMGGGEPLLRFRLWKPYLVELKDQLKEASCELRVTFLSNLAILDEDIINFLKDNSFGIGVSLDGIREFHNKTRFFDNGKGSFNVVEKHMKQLSENNITHGVMTTVSNANLDGLETLTQFVIDNNLHIRFSFVQGEKSERMDTKKLIFTLKKCYEKYDKAIEKGFSFSKLHKLCDLHLNRPFFQTCSNGYNGAALYVDGNIYFCHRHFGTAENPYGSIFEEEDMLSIIQRKTLYDDNNVSSDCKICNLRYLCTSGCPLERENGKDTYCDVYKAILPIIFRLIAKERLRELKKYTLNL